MTPEAMEAARAWAEENHRHVFCREEVIATLATLLVTFSDTRVREERERCAGIVRRSQSEANTHWTHNHMQKAIELIEVKP